MKKIAIWVGIALFVLFVWPTPYHYVRTQKVNRIAEALNVERSYSSRTYIAAEVWMWALLAFGCGVGLGYLLPHRIARAEERLSIK